MEPIHPSVMGNNANTTVASASSVPSAVVGLLLSPPRPPLAPISGNAKTTGLCHQYPPPILVGPATSLIHPNQPGSLLSTPPHLMLPTTTSTAAGATSLPQFHQHNGGSHQLVTASSVPVSLSPIVVPSSNLTTVSVALSPFGILPHERVVSHHVHNRHQHRKLPTGHLPNKSLVDSNSGTGTQIFTAPVMNSQRFYVDSSHIGNKMKQYENIQQQQQQQHKIKIFNGMSDKSLPVVSSSYSPQTYEQRYLQKTTSQQVGYLSVITRTAVSSTNGVVTDDIATNSNYYQSQVLPLLQPKHSDNHEKQYYQFENAVSAPQQQLDNIVMETTAQRNPIHIVKNVPSMHTDMDCYDVKKMVEQQPRFLATDSSKIIGQATLLNNNNNKCIIEQQHQHLQPLPKSEMIDQSLSYNGQYFNRRQPPPAHLHHHHNQSQLQQHIVTGNTEMLPIPTSLTVVSANGNTYLDVQQHQRQHRWNMDQQKFPMVTTSCFPENMSGSVFPRSCPQQPHQQSNTAVSILNAQPPPLSILQNRSISQPTSHNHFNTSSVNPMYYSYTTTMQSPTVTSVTTSSRSSSFDRKNLDNSPQQHTDNFHNVNILQDGNYVVNNNKNDNNNDNKSSSSQVFVPDIEQELSHLCDNSSDANIAVKPLNVVSRQPSFIDSYIKFIHGSVESSSSKTTHEFNDKSKKLSKPLSSSTPKHVSKPYIPWPKTKTVTANEQTSPCKKSSENSKKTNNTITTDDDPRYFPLPKISSITGASDVKSEGSNGEHNWLSSDDDIDQWLSPLKAPVTVATSVTKNKVDRVNKKRKNNNVNKQSNAGSSIKKQKTLQAQQPKRELSHRLAKEKTQILLKINDELNDDDGVLSDADSDVDPAWIPNSDDNDTSKNLNLNSSRHKKYLKEPCPNSEHLPTTSSSVNNDDDQLETTTTPFKSGTFVALKSHCVNNGRVVPQQLWRVDGKSLLQKYLRCDENNVYKSASTYTGWGPSHYKMYRQVAVQFIASYNGLISNPNKSSTTNIFVQLLSDEDDKSAQNNSAVNTKVNCIDFSYISKQKVDVFNSISSTKSSASIDDQILLLRANFDVYIQTLASQALDPNFLEEIYRVNDEFFLSNVRAIDEVTQTWIKTIDSSIRKHSLTNFSKVDNVFTLITKYPIMEICSEDTISADNILLHCILCGCQGSMEKLKFVEIFLSGTEYNSQTLRNIDSDRTFSKVMPSKKTFCCSAAHCTDKLFILHSLEHLKFHIYKECCNRISTENNCSELTQDTTSVLNRLLADDEWIEKLFQMVCNTWTHAKHFVSNSQSNCKDPT